MYKQVKTNFPEIYYNLQDQWEQFLKYPNPKFEDFSAFLNIAQQQQKQVQNVFQRLSTIPIQYINDNTRDLRMKAKWYIEKYNMLINDMFSYEKSAQLKYKTGFDTKGLSQCITSFLPNDFIGYQTCVRKQEQKERRIGIDQCNKNFLNKIEPEVKQYLPYKNFEQCILNAGQNKTKQDRCVANLARHPAYSYFGPALQRKSCIKTINEEQKAKDIWLELFYDQEEEDEKNEFKEFESQKKIQLMKQQNLMQ